MQQLFMEMVLLAMAIVSHGAVPEDAIQSGPGLGERPKPFSVIGVTGSHRGQTHCYICEAEDRPVVIVFARSIAAPLAELAKRIDESLTTHRSSELRGWAVFLTDSRGVMEPKIEQFARQNSIRSMPLTVVEDQAGPPAYRIHRDADITVLFAVKQKLVASHAFKANELTDEKLVEVMASLSKILPKR